MNQILSTSMPSNKGKKNKKIKTSNPADIKSVLKFFSISLIVFAIFLIGTVTYSMYGNKSSKQSQANKPTISIENKTDTTALLKVTHNKNIEKVEYGWNDNEKTIIKGDQRRYIEQQVDIPSGTNTLYVIVTDEEGQEMTYEKQYEISSNINLEVSGNKIKITYDGDKNISYMTYRWDDGDETTVNINNTSISQEIEAIKGLHTLTVVVVDEDNNTDTKTQKINGVSKPKVTIDLDSTRTHFVINASDDEGIKKMEIRLNQDDSKKYLINVNDNEKDIQYTFPPEIQNGENLIEVKVYNINDITEESAAKFVKQ